jgi:tRNA(Ile)-lysidine synthase
VTFTPEVLRAHLAPLIDATGPVALAVALSGGADSAALLAALGALAAQDPRLAVRALHVNHGLSPAAAGLEAAARSAAAATGVALRVLSVTVGSDGGVEAAARTARYAALAAELAPGEALLTAHHLEDQAETLLLQLIRGAGLPGLAAMPASAPLGRGRLLRPLLEVPRQALREYAQAHAPGYQDDPMNADERYDRVYLRARVLPLITARWPGALRTLGRSARHLAAAEALLAARAASTLAPLEHGPALRVAPLAALAEPLRAAAIREWLKRRALPRPPAARLALVARELLAARATGAPRMAYAGVELRVFAGLLYAFPALPPLALAARTLAAEPARLPLEGLGTLAATPAAGAGIRLPPGATLTLALRAGGERLRLRHGGPRRPLKDLLREAGLPPWTRERAILVYAGTLAAVVLPHATWIAAEHAAGPGEAALGVAWQDAPAHLWPAARVGAFH